jgi:hypothetical protein
VSYFTLAQIDGIAGRRCALSACPRCPDRFRNSESTRSANSGNWPVSLDQLVGAGEQRAAVSSEWGQGKSGDQSHGPTAAARRAGPTATL